MGGSAKALSNTGCEVLRSWLLMSERSFPGSWVQLVKAGPSTLLRVLLVIDATQKRCLKVFSSPLELFPASPWTSASLHFLSHSAGGVADQIMVVRMLRILRFVRALRVVKQSLGAPPAIDFSEQHFLARRSSIAATSMGVTWCNSEIDLMKL